MYELKKYHGDRVMSLTYDTEDQSFSIGIISPGEYQFGSIRREIFTVTSGKIMSWVEGNGEWKSCGPGQSFVIPEYKNFKLRVENVSTYICYYE